MAPFPLLSIITFLPLLGALQTGFVYTYAFAMVIGLAAFVTWFWVVG